MKNMTNLRYFKILRDAVHADIDLDRDEIDLINTREFQRLRRIKQLGLAHLVYPSACHTRFEHVLGVCHMAQRIIDSVNRDDEHIKPEERKVIRYLALLHDIGHLPFGHTLEDERPVVLEKHDGYDRVHHFLFDTNIAKVMEKAERDLGLTDLRERVLAILCATKKGGDKRAKKVTARERLFQDIVGNTICADLLDYLKRDTLFTGIQHRYDDRILSSFAVSDNNELFIDLTDDRTTRTGLISEILHLLRLRYTLGERVYYHRTKAAASAMVSKAVEILGLQAQDLYDVGDEELLFLLENPEFFADRIPAIKNTSDNARAAARRLANQLRKRTLHEPVFRIGCSQADDRHQKNEIVEDFHKVSGIAKRRDFEKAIEEEAQVEEGQVILYCPDGDMSLKEAAVKVRFGAQRQLEVLEKVRDRHVAGDITALQEKHRSLWSFEVFVDSEIIAEKGKRIALACAAQLPELTNDIREYRPDPSAIAAHSAIIKAVEMTTKDFAMVPALLEAAHKRGFASLTTPEKCIAAFKDQLGKTLFNGAPNEPKQ